MVSHLTAEIGDRSQINSRQTFIGLASQAIFRLFSTRAQGVRVVAARTSLALIAIIGIGSLIAETSGLPSFYSNLYYPVVLFAAALTPIYLALPLAVLAGLTPSYDGFLTFTVAADQAEVIARPITLVLLSIIAHHLLSLRRAQIDLLDQAREEIEQRLKAEEALRNSEARLRAVVDTAADGIITIDEQGIIRSFNAAAERIFGYAGEEVIGHNVNLLMPSPYREEHDEYIANYLRTGVNRIIGFGREVVGLRKDGTTFPLDLAVSEMQLGPQKMFTGIVRDITERQRTETMLRETNEALQALIQASPLAIMTLDLAGNVQLWNKAAERTFGWTEEEVIGKALPIVPESHRHAFQALRERIMRGEAIFGEETCRQRKDGSLIDVSIWSAPLRDINGQVRGNMTIIADISERKQVEESLRKINQELQALVQASPLAILTLDSEGKVTSWNTAAERMFGWAASEVIGHPLPFVPEQSREESWTLFERVLQGEEFHGVEVVRQRRDGSPVHISVHTGLLYDSENRANGIVSIISDISERKKVEVERERLLRQLDQLAHQLVNIQEEERRHVAYDLHDGLVQIIVAADMHYEAFLARLEIDDPETRKQLERMSQRLKEAIREARRILAELRPSTLDDFGLTEAVRLYLQQLGEQEGWQWDLDADLAAWQPEQAVQTALYRIIQEALTNARKHARTDRVQVSLKLQDSFIQAEVRDWGEGFDVDEAIARAAVGHSLGLIGMAERAQLLNGNVEIVSEPGEGTVVKARIPAQQASLLLMQ